MNGLMVAVVLCTAAGAPVPYDAGPGPRSDFPVRQIVLSEGVLYAIDSEPSRGHCATGLIRPLDRDGTIERLPLMGMCAMEIGRGPYPWSIHRGTFTYLTVNKPAGDPQVICLVAQPSIAQLREYRGIGMHPLTRLNSAHYSVTRGFGALVEERVDAAISAAEMDFHASMHNYDEVILYVLRRGELRVWRSVPEQTNPRQTKEESRFLKIASPMQGPFRVVRFAKRDFLLDATGILYRVEREAVTAAGRIPQGDCTNSHCPTRTCSR